MIAHRNRPTMGSDTNRCVWFRGGKWFAYERPSAGKKWARVGVVAGRDLTAFLNGGHVTVWAVAS